MAEPGFAGSSPATSTICQMNYKKLKWPVLLGRLLDNTKFKMNDGETVCHYLGGKVFVNGVEYGTPTARLTQNMLYVCYPLYFNKAYVKSYGRKVYNGRRERAQARRDKRNRRYDERPHGNSRCYHCGGQMTWCSCCQMYSSDCCQDYGTCQCS